MSTRKILDTATGQAVAVRAVRYENDPVAGHLAGRSVVSVDLEDPETEQTIVGFDLTVEDAIRVGMELLLKAANAMHHDPRPWRIERADYHAAKAALETLNHYRKKHKPVKGEVDWLIPDDKDNR